MQWHRTSPKKARIDFGSTTLIAKYELRDVMDVPHGYSLILETKEKKYHCFHFALSLPTTSLKCDTLQEAVRFVKQIP